MTVDTVLGRVVILLSLISSYLSAPAVRRPSLDVLFPSAEDDIQSATNFFVDDVIAMFRDSWAKKLDPLRIPNQRFSFETTFLSMKIRGDFILENATINGLSFVHRTKDAFLGPDSKSGLMFADVSVEVKDINMTGRTRMSLLGMSLESDVLLEVGGIEARINAYLSDLSGKPIIEDITLTRLYGVSVDLPGLGGVSSLADLVIKGLASMFEGSLKDFVRKYILKFVNIIVNRSNVKLT